MDYIVYQEINGKAVPMPSGIRSRFNTQEEAESYALKLQEDWRNSGARIIPTYLVSWNGTGEIVSRLSVNGGFPVWL